MLVFAEKTNWTRPLWAAAVAVIVLAAGCGRPSAEQPPDASTSPANPAGTTDPASTTGGTGSPAKPAKSAKHDKGAAKSSAAKPPPTEPGSNLNATGTGVSMTFTDPKTGKTMWSARVKRVTAQSPGKVNNAVGTLHDVDGILYQNGKPADHLTAPVVNVDNATQTVVATGGVNVVSITQPGTSLRCEKVTYYASKGRLIGVGNVVFKTGNFAQTGPSFAADVKLKSVVMPAPGTGDGRDRSVTTQWQP